MKAILFIAIASMEIRLADGTSFKSEESEEKDAFVARVTKEVMDDTLEFLEISEEVTESKYKSKNTKQLQKLRKTLTGVELQIVQEILVSRGALEEHPAEGGAVYNGTLDNSDIPEEGSGQEVKDQPAPEGEEKAPRVLKKQLTSEEAIAKLDEADKNKGRYVEFLCTKTKEKATGIIRGVRLDKRNNFIQYRIEVMEGEEKVMYGKGIDSEDLVIGEVAPVPEKPKKEKKAKEEKAAPAEEGAPSPAEECAPSPAEEGSESDENPENQE